jgi:hypothetical protein
MKKIYLFLFACTLALAPGIMQSQSTQDVKEDKKRVVIVKKSIDKEGAVVIEKIIGEGDQADKVLKEMALKDGNENVSITVIKNAEIEGTDENAERLFMFRSSGGEKFEGLIESGDQNIFIMEDHDMHIEKSEDHDGYKNVYIIKRGDGEAEDAHPANAENIFMWHGGEESHQSASKANCAALGVYVNSSHHEKGVKINSLIGGGGAEESGLQEGDYVIAIEDEYVNNYTDLLDVLSRYIPGEDVNVTYKRGDQDANVVVTLKAWRQMPTMANTWRANVTCDEKKDELLETEVIKETNSPPSIPMPAFNNTLQVQDFTVFPNPSEGKFRVQFNATPEPLSVRVTDLTGKVIYRDNLTKFDGIFNDQINVKKYGPGSYVLTIEQNNKVYAEQIIVQ